MTDPVLTPISALAPAAALTGAELLPLVQGGVSKRVTAQAVADLAGAAQQSVQERVIYQGDTRTALVVNALGSAQVLFPSNTTVSAANAVRQSVYVGAATQVRVIVHVATGTGSIAVYPLASIDASTFGVVGTGGGAMAASVASGVSNSLSLSDWIDIPIEYQTGAWFTTASVGGNGSGTQPTVWRVTLQFR